MELYSTERSFIGFAYDDNEQALTEMLNDLRKRYNYSIFDRDGEIRIIAPEAVCSELMAAHKYCVDYFRKYNISFYCSIGTSRIYQTIEESAFDYIDEKIKVINVNDLAGEDALVIPIKTTFITNLFGNKYVCTFDVNDVDKIEVEVQVIISDDAEKIEDAIENLEKVYCYIL